MPNLFVIFHGAWAFVDNAAESCIHAYAADVPQHVYMAGSWLGETKILRGSTLSLTVGGTNCDTPATTPKIRDLKPKFLIFCQKVACPVGAYAEIRLPRPTAIVPQLDAGIATVDQSAGTICDSTDVYLVPVFQFTFDNCASESGIFLESIPDGGQPFWTADELDCEDVTTLHLFAADDTASLKDGDGDFEAVAALFGYGAKLNGTPIELCWSKRNVTIPEMQHRDYEIKLFLNERIDWLHRLARTKRLPLPPPPPVSANCPCPSPSCPTKPAPNSGFHATSVDLTSCGGGGGGS